MAFEWIDKVDEVDDVAADDINSIAHAVQKNDGRISNLEKTSSSGNGANEIVISPYRVEEFDEEDEKALQRADYILDPVSPNRNVEIINEAIQQLRHEDGTTGGEIVFFGGYAPIKSGIIIDLDNVKISGNGVCFKISPDEGNIFEVSGNNVSVSDFNFSEENTNKSYNCNVFHVTGSGFSAENCKLETELLAGWFFYVNGGSHFSAKKCYSETGLAQNNGFFLQAYHANVSNCNLYSIGTPIIVQGAYASVVSNTFSSYERSDFNSYGAKVCGNVFENRDISSIVNGGSGNIFMGNRFVDLYGYESESDCLLEISNNNILVGNEFVTDYESATYPALKINGSNNIYAANDLNSVLDNGENNITYLTSADAESFKTTVNNTLESESETEALSANMGRELNSKISSLESSISGVETILADANAVADSYIEGGTA